MDYGPWHGWRSCGARVDRADRAGQGGRTGEEGRDGLGADRQGMGSASWPRRSQKYRPESRVRITPHPPLNSKFHCTQPPTRRRPSCYAHTTRAPAPCPNSRIASPHHPPPPSPAATHHGVFCPGRQTPLPAPARAGFWSLVGRCGRGGGRFAGNAG
jgi:hypothetical protein